MISMVKVMAGLESHANPKACETCTGEVCPYYNRGDHFAKVTCSSILAADAMKLIYTLKETLNSKQRIIDCMDNVLRIFSNKEKNDGQL